MVATYWPSTCVFNELYLENSLVLLRHTFPITTFSRVDIYWLVLPWDHDQSTVSVLAGYGRGHVCNLGRILIKYFRKDKSVSQRYECIMVTSSNGNIFSVNPEYNRMETNLRTYNGYLKQCIRFPKGEHYVHEFTKYKNDIRKTWDTLKNLINTKKSKLDFPPYFVEHGDKISGSKTIADKFNEYFTKIGPELASSIDTSHKIPFNDYLKSPCQLSF